MTRIKTIGLNVLKIGLTAGLLISLIYYGKLDLKQLGIFFKQPSILGMLVVVWLTSVSLGSLRWQLLLNGAGYTATFFRTIRLQLIGLFFNSAMPGAVGGDLIKVVYVIRENPTKGKAAAMMTILLDRVVGLFGLFTLGFLVMMIDISHVWNSSMLRPLFFATLLMLGVLIVSFLMVAVRWKEGADPFLRLLDRPFPLFAPFKKLYNSFRLYHHNVRFLVYCWLISIFIQFVQFLFFFQIARVVSSPDIHIVGLATVFPVGILTTAIPLAPGGLGVGHVAFDQLFGMINLTHGADVFNLYTLGQLMLNMLGCIPYLLARKKDPSLDRMMTQESVHNSQ